MTQKTSEKPSSQSYAKELKARLREAENLTRKFRFSQALDIVEKMIDHNQQEATVESVLKNAEAFRMDIKVIRRKTQAHLTIIALFVISVCCASVLYFGRVSSTEIIAEIGLKGVYLELANNSALESNRLDSIILYNFEGLEFYADSIELLNISDDTFNASSVQRTSIPMADYKPIIIRPETGGESLRISGNDLRLQRIELYKGAPVNIESAGGTNTTLTIRQNSNKSFGVISTGKDINMECSNCGLYEDGEKTYTITNRLHVTLNLYELQFSGHKRPLDVALLLPKNNNMEKEFPINVPLRISKIDFTGNRSGNPVSLIQTGTINFTELDNRKLSLSKNEFMVIDGLENFRITSLASNGNLHLSLQGNVNSLKSGSGKVLFERKPTLIAWIMNNEGGLRILVATISTIFTFLLAAALRFKIIPKD